MKKKKNVMMISMIVIIMIIIIIIITPIIYKNLQEHKKYSCKGIIFMKCQYFLEFEVGENAKEIIKRHKGKITIENKETNKYRVLLTKKEFEKIKSNKKIKNITRVGKTKSVEPVFP